jgi:histidinol dehydrogenase/sulfopropanediol 3-dehydrogenase
MYYHETKKEKLVTEEDTQQLQETVRDILARVRSEGDSALRFFSRKFDNYEPASFLIPPEEAAKAKDELPPAVVEELDYAIEQVGAFAQAQKDRLTAFESEIRPGMKMGHRIVPLASVGCYVPAGRYPCLTSAVMAVMPAKVAGVKRIIACSSPGRHGSISPGILYTMSKMGVDEIYCLGGVQAIGAMAFGTETIKPVNMVVGPGNQYVAEAKRQIFGEVGIDFLAGPSECLVLADDTARADYVAADLLAQCEHDPNARGCLVTTSEKLAHQTLAEIEKQLKERTTQEVARASWEDHGRVVVVDSLADAARYANEYAPEHLEIHTREPRQVLSLLDNYGSLFIGENTPEVYADKIAGPNHILPTGAAARYTGGLWVGMFLKVITHMEVDTPASIKLARYAETQATYEGMDAHRYAATIRLKDLTPESD